MGAIQDVVVGVLCRLYGGGCEGGGCELLFAQRPVGKAYAGYWEFPGGKVELGEAGPEALEQALRRELDEELGVVLLEAQPWEVVEHRYPELAVRLHFFLCTAWRGEPEAREGQVLRWVDVVQLDVVAPILPATVPLLPALRVAVAAWVEAGAFWRCGRFKFSRGAMPLLMGIVNLTPDSFFDGGRYQQPERALDHASALVEAGARLIDVGAESSRPGAVVLGPEEEWRRLEPVLRQVVAWPVAISVDTYHALTMRRALDMGVDMINDITGFAALENQQAVVGSQAGLCLMHSPPGRHGVEGGDVVAAVGDFFERQLALLQRQGVERRRICLDPGFGFGKTAEENWRLLRSLGLFRGFGVPLLVGVSNKRFVGAASGRELDERLAATLGTQLLALGFGADIVRVHQVAQMRDVTAVWQAAGAPRWA